MKFLKLGLTSLVSVTYIIYSKREKTYSYKEIALHNNESTKIWTTYKNNVYDITDFVNMHPGGKDKIMLSAGQSLEPYWNHYKQHQKKEVFDLLEPMKIGTIKDYNPDKFKNLSDPYLKEPIRSSELVYHTIRPCNAETPKREIQNNPLTPNDLWYVRNHNPVPIIKEADFKLDILENNEMISSYTLEEIKKMPSRKVITTIQCGGNRRSEFENTSGTQWDIGAISTAEWEGVPLCHLLKDKNEKFIHLEGYDGVKTSIPFKKGANCDEDVLLAYKMNNEELPRDHGYPLRVIVPGYVGIKNIKWIKKITLSNEEVDGPWQKGMAYKVLPQNLKKLEDVKKINLDYFPTLEEMPLQSCITNIAKVEGEDKLYQVNGYTYSSKPGVVPDVFISVDNGKQWQKAENEPIFENQKKFKWGWVLWSIKIEAENTDSVLCRAEDDEGNTQPHDINSIWNLRGLANNSVYKTLINKFL